MFICNQIVNLYSFSLYHTHIERTQQKMETKIQMDIQQDHQQMIQAQIHLNNMDASISVNCPYLNRLTK